VFGENGLVPAIVRTMTDQEALEAAIDENDVRDDTSETEQADAAVRALTACGGDRAEAARRLGWSTFKLDRRLALAGLSDAVKAALDERRIKVGHAELLAAVPADKQDKALDTILANGIDVAKTRELLQRLTQNLAAATFDKTECTGCSYNSARQRALFETHVDDGHCTNGACFALKVEAAIAAQVSAAAPAIEEKVPDAAGQCRICDCTEDNACPGGCGWADDTMTLCDNPDCASKAGKNKPDAPAPTAAATPAPAAPAPKTKPSAPATPSKVKVTAVGLAARVTAYREKVWRAAVAAAILESADHVRVADIAAAHIKARAPMAFSQVTELANELEVDLCQTWRVDGGLLDQLNKDELKFIAQECGLIAHMGEKAFAKVYAQTTQSMASSMLHATGFNWAGRIPSCMSLDGKYGPPQPAADGEAA
jgi:ParB family transcriptional regulator, chromosome partitioning protein